MSEFTTPLVVTPLKGRRWMLCGQFSYYTEDGDWTITVPSGFVTDFASIPRAVWWLYPPYGPTWGKAAVVHDYLYATQLDPNGNPIPRKWADQIFLEAMKVLGANWFRRTAMYQAVRWFAGGAWKNHQKRIATEKIRQMVLDALEKKRNE